MINALICCNSCINHDGKGRNLQRILRIKLFINKYDWKEINYSSESDDC